MMHKSIIDFVILANTLHAGVMLYFAPRLKDIHSVPSIPTPVTGMGSLAQSHHKPGLESNPLTKPPDNPTAWRCG